jgi:hypothetical protein
MRKLDPFIDDDSEVLKKFCKLEERSQNAHEELILFSKTKTFKYNHPVTSEYKKTLLLEKMKREAPSDFIKEIANIDKYVSRYKSYLKNKKYKNEEERLKWLKLLSEYEEKQRIVMTLI